MNIKAGQRWQGKINTDVILTIVKVIPKKDGIQAIVVENGTELSYVLSTFETYYTLLPVRSISDIAREIRRSWHPVWFGAVPYLQAMSTLDSIDDTYGLDSAESIVLYFLGNAATWKGPDAKRIKQELKYIVSLAR